MKKCPTCEKTFDDNLRFCQTDGTPLAAVEEAPPDDPYKTVVAGQNDLPLMPEAESVRTGPALIAFTRMPSWPRSAAR